MTIILAFQSRVFHPGMQDWMAAYRPFGLTDSISM